MKELEFKLEGNNVLINTQSAVNIEEFTNRVIGLHRQMKQGHMEIAKMEKDLATSKMNIKKMQQDIDDSLQFFKKIHRDDLVMKVNKSIEELEAMEKQYRAQGPTMNPVQPAPKIEEVKEDPVEEVPVEEVPVEEEPEELPARNTQPENIENIEQKNE